MNEKETLTKGTAVSVKKYGAGVIESVHQQESENGTYPVYHVRLTNDEVRHFVLADLKVAK